MSCRDIFFVLSDVVGAATGSYTLLDSDGGYVFHNLLPEQLNGVTFSVGATISSFRLTNFDISGTQSPCGTPPVPGYGGIDEYTKLMWHFDGNMIDYSLTGSHTGDVMAWNPDVYGGTAAITTTFSKFGSGAYQGNKYMPDGNVFGYGGGMGTMSAVTDGTFNIGTQSFTIDFWYSPTDGDITNYHVFFSVFDENDYTSTPSKGYVMGFTPWKLIFTTFYDGNFGIGSNFNPPYFTTGQWSHIALVRDYQPPYDMTNWKMYVDGVSQPVTLDYGSPGYNFPDIDSAKVYMGSSFFYSLGFPLLGFIDEFRFSMGIARWTGPTFTPPPVPYTT